MMDFNWDTGSSWMWVYDQEGCERSSNCTVGWSYYNTTQSTTFEKQNLTKKVKYADGYV